MSTDTRAHENWFDQGGQAYARFRPEYPPELSEFLAGIAPSRQTAVDVGCGNGQLTAHLAIHFASVIGLDPSADQIANATPQERVRYVCAPAEDLPLPDHSVDLITAAQAAHWFELPRFYAEVRRIGGDDAVIALISYGVLRLDSDIEARFRQFYRDEIGPYWPPERSLVDTGYAGISFPFRERTGETFEIRESWDLGELLGYVSTWSAVRRARQAGREDILRRFAEELAGAWDNPSEKRPMAWPINMRLGTI
jgi:SAM-dependent methyltransferase